MRGEGEQEEADELEKGGESRRSSYIVSTVPLWMGLSYFVSLVPSTQYPHPVGVDVIYIYFFFYKIPDQLVFSWGTFVHCVFSI